MSDKEKEDGDFVGDGDPEGAVDIANAVKRGKGVSGVFAAANFSARRRRDVKTTSRDVRIATPRARRCLH